MAVTFTHDAADLTLFSRHQRQLPASGQRLAVDLGEATASECCHADIWLRFVARRVAP